tara:strand:- start:202 stop:366 length:165 start_codon:yes stop_codon:yes gene_type:complete
MDEYSRECLCFDAHRKIIFMGVLDRLTDLFMVHEAPRYISTDNGPEFVAEKIRS